MSLKCCCMHAKSLWSCPTLCNPMDCSLPGSSVHGTLQARILEWVCHALLQFIFLTQGLNPRLLHLLHWWVLYHLAPPGKVKSKSHTVVPDPLWPHGQYSPWNSPGQNTGEFPSPGDLPNPGIKPRSPTLQVDSLPVEPQRKPKGALVLLQFWGHSGSFHRVESFHPLPLRVLTSI